MTGDLIHISPSHRNAVTRHNTDHLSYSPLHPFSPPTTVHPQIQPQAEAPRIHQDPHPRPVPQPPAGTHLQAEETESLAAAHREEGKGSAFRSAVWEEDHRVGERGWACLDQLGLVYGRGSVNVRIRIKQTDGGREWVSNRRGRRTHVVGSPRLRGVVARRAWPWAWPWACRRVGAACRLWLATSGG